jgi:polyisoprenoid-binding protein YceI
MSDNGGASGAHASVIDVSGLVGTAAGHWALDPAGSRFEFHVKHFWGAITVHGTFGRVSGEADVAADGTLEGTIVMDATSLDTKNKQRDRHLRSADFFDVERHPTVALTITSGKLAGPDTISCEGMLQAAGQSRPVTFTAQVQEATASATVLTAEFEVDRTAFDMTWSPLGSASAIARGTAIARFVRQ